MKISIVIIDDLWPMVYGIKTFLESTGLFTIPFTATNGLDFIEKMNKSEITPDLILVDPQMPFMNGPEVVRWIRKDLPNVLCVGICLSSRPNDRTLMLAAGCCGCLNKDDDPQLYIKGLEEVSRLHFIHHNSDDYAKLMLFKDFHDPCFTEKDFILIQCACSDKTNGEIAIALIMSESKVVRELSLLYIKCDVKNRAGLILKARDLGWAV